MFRGIVAATLLALLLPGVAHAYGWPLKPFDRMHPIRGSFDDPRFHVAPDLAWKGTFHFGVDISAPDGTPVYAVEAGTITHGHDWVDVHRPNRRVFGYWHVRPVVRAGAHVRMHQLLGYVLPGWGHVHFAESVAGQYRNPLRPGALTPYREANPPVVDAVSAVRVEAHTLQSEGADVSGTVALIADAYQLPTIAPAPPWNRARLVPSVVRWRIIPANGDPPTPWRTVADFRYRLLPGWMYPSIYAPGTYQNKPNRPGDYRFWLTQAFDTTTLPNGTYWIDVQALDLSGAVGENEIALNVAN
ncbi:MAG: M23 family metallopeptidase [Acidobacteriota bacterium]|nr:M23 family metallopeptidase [Acidobacteriota bacterium]